MTWYQYEFWRFVLVQQKVEVLAQSAIEFPPMQRGASFGLSAVKAQIEEAAQARAVDRARAYGPRGARRLSRSRARA